jgi:hypothetical protein
MLNKNNFPRQGPSKTNARALKSKACDQTPKKKSWNELQQSRWSTSSGAAEPHATTPTNLDPPPPAKSQTATYENQPLLNSPGPGVRGRAKTNEWTRKQNKTTDEKETNSENPRERERESTWRRSGATRARAADCGRLPGGARGGGGETDESRRICGGEGEDWGLCGRALAGVWGGGARARGYSLPRRARDHVTRASRSRKAAAIGRWGSSAPVWGREAVRACGSGSARCRVGSREVGGGWQWLPGGDDTRLAFSVRLCSCSAPDLSRDTAGFVRSGSARPGSGRLPGRLGTTRRHTTHECGNQSRTAMPMESSLLTQCASSHHCVYTLYTLYVVVSHMTPSEAYLGCLD